jgi:predicted nucleic acid-binding protein
MTDGSWLIDKSAFVRLHQASDPELWLSRIDRGLVRVTSVTLLEIGFSARNAPDHDMLLRQPPVDSMPVEYLRPAHEDRALMVQRALAEQGRHRAVSIPDLLIAAVAELAGLTVMHVDHDFELVSAITGQPLEWLETS